MTVKELIQALSALDPDMPVFRLGYEDGYYRVLETSFIGVTPDPEHTQWTGAYREAKTSDSPDVIIHGVLI